MRDQAERILRGLDILYLEAVLLNCCTVSTWSHIFHGFKTHMTFGLLQNRSEVISMPAWSIYWDILEEYIKVLTHSKRTHFLFYHQICFFTCIHFFKLRCNSHIIKFTLLKCTIQYFWVQSQPSPLSNSNAHIR